MFGPTRKCGRGGDDSERERDEHGGELAVAEGVVLHEASVRETTSERRDNGGWWGRVSSLPNVGGADWSQTAGRAYSETYSNEGGRRTRAPK